VSPRRRAQGERTIEALSGLYGIFIIGSSTKGGRGALAGGLRAWRRVKFDGACLKAGKQLAVCLRRPYIYSR
jgi:hypothetical protein